MKIEIRGENITLKSFFKIAFSKNIYYAKVSEILNFNILKEFIVYD